MPRGKSATKSKPGDKAKSDARTKRVRRTTVEEEEVPVENEEEAEKENVDGVQQESMSEPEEAKDEIPDFVRDLFEDFEDEQFDAWHVAIDRYSPEFTSKQIKLRRGEVKRLPGLFMGIDEIIALIERENGGGIYFIRVCDASGRIRKKKKIVIEGEAKATPLDVKHHKEVLGELPSKDIIERENEKDEADRLERERRLWELKLESERARREFERERRRMDKLEEMESGENEEEDEDEDEGEDERFHRGPRTPEELAMMGYRPRIPRNPEDIEKELSLKYENRELKQQLGRMQERMEAIQDTLKAKPIPVEKSNGFDAASITTIIVKALEVLKPAPQKTDPQVEALRETVRDLANKINTPQTDPVEAMIRVAKVMKEDKDSTGGMKTIFETMLPLVTGQMQAGNQMLMQSMQEMNKTQAEMTRQAVMQILEGGSKEGEPEDWKVTALKKGLDTVETFGKEIVGFNKEKLNIEQKKLDLIEKGRIVPVEQKQIAAGRQTAQRPAAKKPPKPAPKPPVQPSQSIQAQPAMPQTPKPEVAGVGDEKVKEVYTYANNLLQAAIQAFLKDEDPAEFAKRTLQIGGPDVTEWLMESEGIGAIEKLATEFGQEVAFNKWIAGNAMVKTWLNKWIEAVKRGYKFEGEKGKTEAPKTGEPVSEFTPEHVKPRKKAKMEDKPKPIRPQSGRETKKKSKKISKEKEGAKTA